MASVAAATSWTASDSARLEEAAKLYGSVVELFEIAAENTPVYIYENNPASADPED